MRTPTTRRKFLSLTTSAAASTWAGAGLFAAGASAAPGPNETINLGIIGCGHRCRELLPCFSAPGSRVVAVCDVNSKRLAEVRELAGGERVRAYHDYRQLLANKDVDAVLIATNVHWHVLCTIHACQAGKDVYVEKPLCHFSGEGPFAIAAAKKYDRIVQIGTNQHSCAHYRKAVEKGRPAMLCKIQMHFRCCLTALLMAVGFVSALAAQAESPTVTFSKRCLIVDMNEGCAVADVNRDGKPDIIAGEHWYAAPEFIPRPVRHIPPVLDLPAYLNNELLQNTGDHPFDVDGDGWVDVISVGWTDKEICWYQNPAGRYDEHPWKRHVLGAIAGENEAIALHDFDGDGRPEIYVSAWNKKKPQVIHRLTNDARGQPALQPVVIGPQGGHGYAFGDVNGDGREDIQCESGWYERPPGDVFQQPWKFHPETALPHPSIPCVLARLTDSGRTDLIWGKAHDYGLYWWEQGPPKPDGTTTWTEHLIDKSWSQPHGMTWADIDGDGQSELITGKRVRAHVDKDLGSLEPECLYYYHWDKAARRFTRHTISAPGQGVGMGMQICVADLNADGRPDIVVAGKTGTWLLLNVPSLWR